eukprot:2734002-Pleurochrysis_carterae.AAC.2
MATVAFRVHTLKGYPCASKHLAIPTPMIPKPINPRTGLDSIASDSAICVPTNLTCRCGARRMLCEFRPATAWRA